MASSSVFCIHCGAALRADTRFCAACGHAVAPPPAPTLVPARPTSKKNWSATRILVLIFIILPLLIIAAVTLALFVWSNLNPLPCGCVFPPTPSSQSSQVINDYTAGI